MYDPFAPSRYASATAALQGAQLGEENISHGGSQEDRMIMTSDFKRAQLDQADAEKQLEVLRQLAKTGAASQGELDAAEHRLALSNTGMQALKARLADRYSKTEVSTSEARVADARATLETARAVLAQANVTSTIPGTVYSVPVTENDFVPMGAELLRVTDLSKVQVRAYIDEPEMGRLAVNEAVNVTWEAKPDKVWHGHITQIPLTVAGMGARMVGSCMVSIDDADGSLLPNTDVAVNISTARIVHALTISRAAVHDDGADRVVFRVIGGKLVRTPVQVGILSPHRAQIIAGLSEHDIVAVNATTVQDLSDGLNVTVAP
jgi:HlyD family secretion protein